MMLPPTPRVLFLRELVAAIRRKAAAGRVVVAVDGGRLDGGFADDLAAVFREAGADTFRASISDFHSSRAYRTRLGPETPESSWNAVEMKPEVSAPNGRSARGANLSGRTKPTKGISPSIT